MSDKLDRILEEVAGIKPVLKDVVETMIRVEQSVKAVEIKNAEQDVKLDAANKYLENIAEKVRRHIDGHWGYLASVFGTIGLGLALMKFYLDR